MSLVSFFPRGYRNTSVAGNGLRGFTVNPFLTNVPVLYPLKSFGFLMFSRGYRSGTLVENGSILQIEGFSETISHFIKIAAPYKKKIISTTLPSKSYDFNYHDYHD